MFDLNNTLTSFKEDIEREILALSDDRDEDLALFTGGQARRAETLLKAAPAPGNGQAAAVKNLAVALELLELGIRKQFETTGYGTATANLRLITADSYYARALELTVALGDDRYVSRLCDALAEASEDYAAPSGRANQETGRAFLNAAEDLGRMLSEERK